MELDIRLKCVACGSEEFELQCEITDLEGFIDSPCRRCGQKVTNRDIEKLKDDVGKKLGDLLSKRYSKK
ncbi:ECs_2282 family putative zinc-binding protein [Pseudomonas sp. PSPC3-3]|uniref:ECs_2282 family putative zinc-binding protein n=1 Tax=unclassified Pseudomonas TaxID=196821 RepID=UPI003CEF7713